MGRLTRTTCDYTLEPDVTQDNLPGRLLTMMGFSEAEAELLVAMKLITLTRGAADAEAFEAYRSNAYTKASTDWTEAFASLTARGLLRREHETWHLTDAGHVQAELVHRSLLERCSRTYYANRVRHVGPDRDN